MNNMIIINLNDWDEFEKRLPVELRKIEYSGLILVRNFSLQTYDVDEKNELTDNFVDRLSVAIETGTDRDINSPFWNVEGHDYEHNKESACKSASDVIYAYVAEFDDSGYSVHYQSNIPEKIDLTDGLNELDGILIYDQSKLKRVSKNEHWFLEKPIDTLLMIFKLKGS